MKLPDIFLNTPDEFESGGCDFQVESVLISNITEIAWTVDYTRKEIEDIFRNKTKKVPLILVEKKGNGIYELHDGQHRYAAYRNIFPSLVKIKVAVFKST